MSVQVLKTKLFAPPHRAGVVPRPRLAARLDEGTQRKLTLLSAPAGFGKTTVVSEWAALRGRRVAWLSLDPGDGHGGRFLAHLTAALRTLLPSLGEGVLAALDTPRPPPTEWLVTELLNDLAAAEQEVVVVLDDFHTVDAEPVDAVVRTLLDHLPAQVHVVITTREDPDLGLARLRARRQLTELRATDLRFTSEETTRFLAEVTGLELSDADVASLEARTEGWVVGLQLAALSMQGRDDVQGFIEAFSGDHRYIVDYLVEEVLHRQTERVRRFLMHTSILERLSGALCDAVTGQQGGGALLDELERSNLFVVPLDDHRRWYRYHHLFGDVLQAHLRQEDPDRVPDLHRRASAWFEAEGEPAEAVRHALAGGDVERAARLIELSWRAMDSTFRSAVWLGWVDALPAELIASRPVLGVGCAWARLNAGELEIAEKHLEEVEAWIEAAGGAAGHPDGAVASAVVDQDEARTLPATVASARAYHALAVGDPVTGLAQAHRALELLPEDDHLGRGIPLGLVSLAHWANGDLEEAYGMLDAAMAGFRAVGSVSAAISGVFAMADIRATQGRLREAAGIYEDGLRLVEERAEPDVPGVAELYVGLADVQRERGDLEAAERHLRHAWELGERAVLPGDEARLRTVMARLEAGLGNPERALALLEEAQRLRIRSPMPDLRPIRAWRARVDLQLGRLEEATAWARDRDRADPDAPSYLHEFEHLVLARILVAGGRRDGAVPRLDEALALLARLLRPAEEGGRTSSVLEVLVLQALALDARGDARAAAEALDRALALAAPEGFVRLFLDEGAPMAALLRRAGRRGPEAAYARRLLGAPAAALSSVPTAQPSFDAMTDREAEVLRLLTTDLSGPEIARQMNVSLNTFRTHVKNVYGKLGVNSRRTAVRRARDLDLV